MILDVDQVECIGIVRRDGFPYLCLRVAGRPVELGPDQQKASILEAGLVYIGFEDELPPVEFQVPGEPGRIEVLRGYTANPTIVRLYREHLELINRPAHENTPPP